MIYGCDICQQVCPYNKGKDFHLHPEMEPSVEETHPLLKPLVTISNKEFKERLVKWLDRGVEEAVAEKCDYRPSQLPR